MNEALVKLNDLIRKGWTLQVYMGGLKTPTALATREDQEICTDDFNVEKLIHRLHDKCHGTGDYECKEATT